MSRILLLTSHSIAEFDDLRMLHQMGHEVFSIGAYTNPAEPGDDKRPALPEVPYHADLAAACERQRAVMAARWGDPAEAIDWAKAHLADEVIDWADTIICHHFPHVWIAGQWARIRHKRVIWRTCGQSNSALEQYMAQFRREGLQIVRYSPKERNLPFYAGEDAVIRFGKEPDEWCGWTGEDPVVGNVTQNMLTRGDACGLAFWQEATRDLWVKPAGPGSEALCDGIGPLSYEDMREYLRRIRVYLYTGTQPASYTLGLIEAMMTGVPVVSIGPKAFGPGWVGQVFEGHEIVREGFDDPAAAQQLLRGILEWPQQWREYQSGIERQRAIDLFGMDAVKAQWATFIGAAVPA